MRTGGSWLGREKLLSYLPVVMVLLVVVSIRVRLLNVPLERDEGEYAYIGQLILHGIPPYVNAYTMKLPGVGIAYALFMLVFGQTPFGIHCGLLLVNVASTMLLWLVARRVAGETTATAAAAIYPLLCVSRGVFGVFAHATHFVILFVLAGFWLLLIFLAERRPQQLALSGVLFGLAICMKQHAAPFAIFALGYLIWNLRGEKNRPVWLLGKGALWAAGAAAPMAAIVGWAAAGGVLSRFWLWTFEYARDYATSRTVGEGLSTFWSQAAGTASWQLPLWLCAGAGAVLLLMGRGEGKVDRLFLCGLLVSALAAISPGFYFREHYFVMLLPCVALFAAFAIDEAATFVRDASSRHLACALPAALLAVAVGSGLYLERDYFFHSPPEKVSRDIFGLNPFPDSQLIARYIREQTSPADRVVVFGSEPQIYFYARRLSATGHIYMYGLSENHANAWLMQQEMIREVESHKPLYVVMVAAPTSLPVTATSRELIEWANDFIDKHYRLAGVADIHQHGTTLLWEEEIAGYRPSSISYITIWKRKG